MDILKDVFRKRMRELTDVNGDYWLCPIGPDLNFDLREQGCFLHKELEPAACE